MNGVQLEDVHESVKLLGDSWEYVIHSFTKTVQIYSSDSQIMESEKYTDDPVDALVKCLIKIIDRIDENFNDDDEKIIDIRRYINYID